MSTTIEQIFLSQKSFFETNTTKSISFRIETLKQLKEILKLNEAQLDKAIFKDLHKSSFENYETELVLVYKEINLAIKNLRHWSRPKRVKTNLPNLPGKSYIYPEPYGISLIIGTWNYPYLLNLSPLVSAIAAGNTAIIKPSELSENTSEVLSNLLNTHFPNQYIYVKQGGVETANELLNLKFDKIFFTGSTKVGKIVMEHAAKNLIPVTLELGGKSPAIVMNDANLKIAAKRITWGKFLNAGQTCIAPDYLLVQKPIKDKLLEYIKAEIKQNYGSNPSESEAYIRIINKNHFMRLTSLIEKSKIYYGGDINEDINYISPTILDNVSFADKVMEDEIFGPILPVLEFSDLNDTLNEIKSRPKPLSLYIFSSNLKIIDEIIKNLSFGSCAVNDTVMQISNPNLPFGGIGDSGIGAYHSYTGFKEFSHFKSVLFKSTWFEPFIKYPPYNKFKKWLLKLFIE